MIWNELLQHAKAWLAEYSWRFLAAAVILVLGLLLAAGIRMMLMIALRARKPRSRKSFFIAQSVWLAVVVLTLSLVLVALGLAGPVIGFIVTVGLALGVLADSLGGLRILGSQPFRVGDMIEIKGEGVTGSVVQISISDTVLMTADNTEVIVPNRKLFDRLIVNHSPSWAVKLLRFQFVLDPLHGVDVLEEQIRAIMKTVPGIKFGKDEHVWVTLIEANSVTFNIQFPASPFEAERTGSEFLKTAKTQFDSAGVAIRSLSVLPE
jgi:small conductance mechanosensitive channel